MASSTNTVIGGSTRIRGRVTGSGDVQIQGFVEGEVAVTGDVTVDARGMVGAGVQGQRLVVRGAIKGDLVGEEAVVLESGARVVGDVRAPSVAIGDGALLRGRVETGEDTPPRSTRAQASARAVAAPPKPAAVAAAKPVAATKPVVAARPAVVAAASRSVSSSTLLAGGHGASHASAGSASNNSTRRPPPPVLPVLKKARGQIAKKRER